MAIQTVQIPCSDGFTLAGDLHTTDEPPRLRALIAPAMGVKRRLYRSFALELAKHGIETLTLDYRGIGDSLKGPITKERVKLHQWAELDLTAAVSFLRSRGDAPIVWIGHSVGGQLMGLVDAKPIHAAVFVASQSGYWKNWEGMSRALIFGLWHVLIPVFTTLTGRLPMRAFRQGEDVPKNVAREWASWGRHPRYIMRYADARPGCAFKTFDRPLRAYAITDDGYAPPPSVAALLGFYERTKGDLRTIAPADVGSAAVGHFNFFRERYRQSLWKETIAWLDSV